jgi:hypothetical protein
MRIRELRFVASALRWRSLVALGESPEYLEVFG